MLLRIQVLRIEAMHLQARAALASAVGQESRQRLQMAERLAGKISKEHMLWAEPLACLIRAGVAYRRAQQDSAITYLSDAIDRFEMSDMRLYSAAAKYYLAKMISGNRAEQFALEAEDFMNDQKIKNPASLIRMLAPGFD
jgi:hypothetical protein